MPWRHGPGGWARYRPMRVREPVHLWHASMAESDRDLIATLRAGDTGNDWNQVAVEGEKNEGAIERPRFQYYAGENPGWPEALLQAEYRGVMEVCETIRLDRRSIEERIEQNIVPPNPVATKALTHLTLGSPQSVYNGGLLRAQVRYFDAQRQRPGLPPDVAALVTGLSADRTALTLINLSPDQSHSVIIQSGAFGEHEIRDVALSPYRGTGHAAHHLEQRPPRRGPHHHAAQPNRERHLVHRSPAALPVDRPRPSS